MSDAKRQRPRSQRDDTTQVPPPGEAMPSLDGPAEAPEGRGSVEEGEASDTAHPAIGDATNEAEATVEGGAAVGASGVMSANATGWVLAGAAGVLGVVAAASGGGHGSSVPAISQVLQEPVTPAAPKPDQPKAQDLDPVVPTQERPSLEVSELPTPVEPKPESPNPSADLPSPTDPAPVPALVPNSIPTPTLALKNDTGPDLTGLVGDVGDLRRFAHDGLTRDGTIVVSGLQAGATWAFSLDSGRTWQAGVGAEISSRQLGADGDKQVWVRQIDGAGQISEHAALALRLDTHAGRITVQLSHDDGPSATDAITTDPTLRIGGLEAGALLVWFGVTDRAYHVVDGAPEIRLPSALGDNFYPFLRQIDAAGNEGPELDVFRFTLVALSTSVGTPSPITPVI
ncbi:MAG: hypothetical protein J7598_06450 [Mitsuaria chitosanitabida]|uniref:hypothetical protein n=1 Tax=Roseateles chitosanitabidus TaxID=65048 RepID=UPI001B1312D8|nr:hypothetical protein [Roseateles chitosanitabidus]MBO9686233.1 hypothetical protein [Roseateles chitosanitabidus]